MTLEPRPPEPGPSPRVVRPYVLTQGRTKAPESTYGLEAQVRALVPPTQLDRAATPEARRIVELCQRATSVAEVAARMTLPLGVARVLVGDLVAVGALAVDVGSPDAATDVALLERLLDGIRAL
jgi:Protein of unknown function (DUF742)